MATTAVNSWNAIKARHEALRNDAKFKPDKLTALCARLDTNGTQLDKQNEEKEKAEKIIDDATGPYEACTKRITTQHGEVERIAGQMGEMGLEDGDLKGDDAVKTVTKACALFVNKTDELAEAAQEIAKASKELAGVVKKMSDQYKAKREAVDAAIKKIKADGAKCEGDIKKQVAAYQKIANDMKDREMAGDIGSLNSIVSQLYSFQ